MVIYVSAPRDDIKDVCALILRHGHTPIAPSLYFPLFTYEKTRAQNAELMNLCDCLWVVGDIGGEEVSTARGLYIPVQHFSGIEAVKEKLKTVQRRRSFAEIIDELLKVSNGEDANESLAYAMVAAQSIQGVTHIDRSVLEDILFFYKGMLTDMEKIQFTAEEYAMVVKEIPTSLAYKLELPKELVELVLRLDRERLDGQLELQNCLMSEMAGLHGAVGERAGRAT